MPRVRALDPAPSSSLAAYGATSAWNLTLAELHPSSVPVHADSATFMARVYANKGVTPLRNYLGSDATQSTLTVYEVTNADATVPVRIWDSWRYGNDASCDGTYQAGTVVDVPWPAGGVKAQPDQDWQTIILNTDTGDEWNFWKVGHSQDWSTTPGLDASDYWITQDVGGGTMQRAAVSGGRYQADPADGTSGGVGGFITGLGTPSNTANPKAWNMRGAKIPYLTGLVRRAEVDAGVVEHAVAWAYRGPSPEFTYPAMNSDGANFGGVSGTDLPEGARIRLRPDFDLTAFPAGTARIVGLALQQYGAILIDNSGYPKMYLEAQHTAAWGADVTASMLSAATLADYEVIDWTV